VTGNVRLRNILSCTLALIMAACLLTPSAAAESRRPRVVKVAVLNDTTFADQDENGVWSGMDVEFMISVAQKAGFTVEFIDSFNDPDFLGSLDNGTYDIVADVVKTPAREGKYLFTDETMGSINNTLAVRSDDDRWDYGNIDQISDMNIGVLSTYANNADFRDWCAKHNITPKITEFENIAEMSAALQSGKIDGEVYSAIYGEESDRQFRTILKFLPEYYYFAFRKDDVELKNQVDTAISQILSSNRDYLVNLKNDYETQYKSNILPLSSGEKAYIAAHPQLTVAVTADDKPYYYKDSSGADKGIIPDYYALVADWTGCEFKYAAYDSTDDAINAVTTGKADIMGIFSDGLISAYANGLSLTDTISAVSCILLTNPGTDISAIKSIAAMHASVDSIRRGVSRSFPNAGIAEYGSAEDCFSALKKGETDAAIVGMPGATWLINQTRSTSYSVVPVPGVTFNACGAVRADEQTLCSILSKGIAATKGSFTGITTRDTLPQSDWAAAISRVPPLLTVLAVCILTALVIGLTWSLLMLRRRQRERAAVLAAQNEAEQQRIRAEESEKSAEEKNAFFSNISHDMRTPLNAVIGFAGLGEKEPDAGRKNEYFAKIASSGALLNSLIDDTLTISKINSGKLTLKPEPTRAAELYGAIIDPIREAAKSKNIQFTADSSGMLDRTIMADKLSLQKICLNLLSNAVKYTPEGGHVSLRLYNDPADAAEPDSVLEVSDDGIGISADFLPHIFEPFAQERRSGYESVGTGLGLSIVKQLVDLMGGTIQVRSEENKGTTFTLRWHFSPAEEAAPSADAMVSAQPAELCGRKVLLCEDNALNREIAVAILGSEGMSVDTAENGSVGVSRFSHSAPGEYSAVLMDIRMPVMDGCEAARQIRGLSRPDALSVPIIAMTADAFADDVQKCLDCGMNSHVAKPIDTAQLISVLRSLLG
jgi:signal transduction histidine kinase